MATLAWELWLVTLAWEFSLGSFGLGTSAYDFELGNLGLGFCAWGLSFTLFRLGSFAWGTWVWEAGGTNGGALGEPARACWSALSLRN